LFWNFFEVILKLGVSNTKRLPARCLTYLVLRYYQTIQEVMNKSTFLHVKEFFLRENSEVVSVNPFKLVCRQKENFYNALKCAQFTRKSIKLSVTCLCE
jgi:hypothetical protein